MKTIINLMAIGLLFTACSKNENVIPEIDTRTLEEVHRDSLVVHYSKEIPELKDYDFVEAINLEFSTKVKAVIGSSKGKLLYLYIDENKKVINKISIVLPDGTTARIMEQKPDYTNDNVSVVFVGSDDHPYNEWKPSEVLFLVPSKDTFKVPRVDVSEIYIMHTKPTFYSQNETYIALVNDYSYIFDKEDARYLYKYATYGSGRLRFFLKDGSIIIPSDDHYPYSGFKISRISNDQRLREDLPYEQYDHKVYWEKIIHIASDWIRRGDERREMKNTVEEFDETIKYTYHLTGWKYDANQVLQAIDETSTIVISKETGEIL